MLGLVALVSLAAYLITPESAAGPAGDPAGFAFNLRYAAPPLALSLAILPLAPALDGPRRQAAVVAVLAAVLLATIIQAFAVARPPRPRRRATRSGAAGRRRGAGRDAAARALAPARCCRLAAVLLLAGAAAGYGWQRHYLRGRYQFNPGVSYLSHVWAFFRGVHDARVGVVGTFGGFFAYPLWGPDDSNRVQYIGARGPHGSFAAIASCHQWRRAINAGRYRLRRHDPGARPLAPQAAEPLARGSLDRHRSHRPAGATAGAPWVSGSRCTGSWDR